MMVRHHDIDVGSFNLGSDQSLPPELAKHDPLDRPQVIIGASITVCDLVYVLSTKWLSPRYATTFSTSQSRIDELRLSGLLVASFGSEKCSSQLF